jgi:hypothetical protein
MLARENGEVESESEEMPPLENGEALVIRHALNIQIKKDVDQQRENIFHI